jgi:uncharacterized protein with ParB-like and HNH nuclease domain
MKFSEIKHFEHPSYRVNVPWDYLESHLSRYEEYGLIYNPDFQRGYVWNEQQQIKYVEYIL